VGIQEIGRSVKKILPPKLYPKLLKIYFLILWRLGPRYAYWKLGRKLKNPITYGEKTLYKAAFDRDPMLTKISDKIEVRRVVEELIGEKYLSKAYVTTYDPDSIDWRSLPREYVCKANHGCGAIIIVWDGADPNYRLPTDANSVDWAVLQVHPDHADPELMTAILKRWLTRDYSWDKRRFLPEWAYKNIKRGILIEEFLRDENGQIPIDYKLYVIHGQVKWIRAISGRNNKHRSLTEFDASWNAMSETEYDRNWKPVDIQIEIDGKKMAQHIPPKLPPSEAQTLIKVAEMLGSVTDSVRVDLYAIRDRVIFGELTLYSNAGKDFYIPDWYNYYLGSAWKQKPYPRR
jgi:hypothetical protein